MPKINVYLPDDLAEAVKQAGVPVSAICQRALEQAVRRVTAIRETAPADLDLDRPTGALTLLTPRTRTVLKLASARAGSGGVETEHLLAGMLAEGTNLALHVLRAMDIDPGRVSRDLTMRMPEDGVGGELGRPAGTGPGETPGRSPEGGSPEDSGRPEGSDSGSGEGPGLPEGGGSAGVSGRPEHGGFGGKPGPSEGGGSVGGPPGSGSPGAEGRRFGVGAANALEFAVNEAISLGHNYVGCEHLLLGLVAEPDGIAGQVLRGLGAELRPTRRAVVAALAGYVHLRAESGRRTPAPTGTGAGQVPGQPIGQGTGSVADPAAMLTAVLKEQLAPVVQRISRLEEHLGLGSGD
ncbi:Clp protease N-terminal domain-containing protein [Nonomuraea sp. NPDC048826]|uniref:Clp protease N-terminal domain-containing protein n=1 Tax=Nonomuraea sp. NPDC048826 TaxID=3364347 RepID=UPI003721B24A